MRNITIIWTITLVLIVGCLTLIGLKIKDENISDLMEEELVNQTEKYLGLYPALFPALGEKKTFSAQKLKDEGYDAKLESDCDGYVVVENTTKGYTYKAYVKCPDYVTEGYSVE